MVGVAGRSKGCRTCRKRKKGCDLQRPGCGQCKERGSACGGYDSDRIFINKGYDPTVPSSKAENLGQKSLQISYQDSKLLPDTSRELMPVTTIAANQDVYIQSRILPSSLARSAFSEKSMEAVFDMFLISGIPRAGVGPTSGFASVLPKLSLRDTALQTTVLAVGLVVLGEGVQNQGVVQQGRAFYGQALRELGVALQDPVRRKSEALLVVPQLLGLYEILFGASTEEGKQAGNWTSHAHGELVLLLDRGPDAYSSDTAHVLFTQARYSSIITAIRSRSATVLNDEPWKTRPWTNRVKTSEDTLLDVLAEIPVILGALDRLDSEPTDGDQYQGLRLETLAKCWTAHVHLKTWIDDNSEKVYSPVTDEPIPIVFPNLGTALQSVLYWATATLLYQSLDRAMRITASDSDVMCNDTPHPRIFVHFIVRSISYLLRKDNGVKGATSVSFPLGVALLYMRQSAIHEPEYMAMVFRSWNGPLLPTAIKNFLASMRSVLGPASRRVPINHITWSTRE